MKLTLVAFAAAVAVAGVASCSDEPAANRSEASAAEPSSTGTAASDDSAASLSGEDELADGLLTIDDVPTGWAEVPQHDDDPMCGIRITKLLGLDVDTLPSATVEYAEDPDTGPGFGETVGFVPAGRGADVLHALDEAIANCDGDTVNGWDATISALSFPPVGDDSAAYRITLTHPDLEQSTHVDVVYAVTGDLATVAYAFDLYGDPTDTLATYAPKAIRHAIQSLGTTPPAQ